MRKSDLMMGMVVMAAAAVSPSYAQTLEEETRATIVTSPVLGAERARLEAVRETRAVAWSELLPQISLDASAVDFARGSDSNAAANNFFSQTRELPNYWVATIRSSTLLFGSGRVWASTRQARAQIASALALYQDAVQNLALELANAYGEARFARAALEAQEQSLANLQEQERFARANLREGFLTRTDVAQAEARVALARADLARARSRVIQADQSYMRITGHPPGALEAPAALSGLPASLEAAIEAAQDHPALVAAAADIQVAEAAVDSAASNGRMRIFLDTAHSRLDAMENYSPRDIRWEEDYEQQVSLRVSIPLFSGGANRARTRQQRHLRDAANYQLADVQRRVRENVTVAWSQLDAARARLESAGLRLEAAELASRGVRREQQFGQRSMIDVLNQEQELLTARIGLGEAQRDIMIAERSLAVSAGLIAPLLGPAG
jgi:outer membrane protein